MFRNDTVMNKDNNFYCDKNEVNLVQKNINIANIDIFPPNNF